MTRYDHMAMLLSHGSLVGYGALPHDGSFVALVLSYEMTRLLTLVLSFQMTRS
jgi:hypothetical protein